MQKSNSKSATPTARLRAALLLRSVRRSVSVPKIAAKHGVKVSTLYAVLNGTRSDKKGKTRTAVAEIERIAVEELGALQ